MFLGKIYAQKIYSIFQINWTTVVLFTYFYHNNCCHIQFSSSNMDVSNYDNIVHNILYNSFLIQLSNEEILS